MNICGLRHEDIAYEKRLCSLCEVIAERDRADARIQELESQAEAVQ